MQILFTFTFNTESKEIIYRSNIAPPEAQLPVALQILQNALIAGSQMPNGKGKPDTGKKEVSDKV